MTCSLSPRSCWLLVSFCILPLFIIFTLYKFHHPYPYLTSVASEVSCSPSPQLLPSSSPFSEITIRQHLLTDDREGLPFCPPWKPLSSKGGSWWRPPRTLDAPHVTHPPECVPLIMLPEHHDLSRGAFPFQYLPADCRLHPFEPEVVAHVLRNKTLVFLGDSMTNQQVSSFLCLLSNADQLEKKAEKHYILTSHNVTILFGFMRFFSEWRQHKNIAMMADYLIINCGAWYTGVETRQPTLNRSKDQMDEVGLARDLESMLDLFGRLSEAAQKNTMNSKTPKLIFREYSPAHFQNTDDGEYDPLRGKNTPCGPIRDVEFGLLNFRHRIPREMILNRGHGILSVYQESMPFWNHHHGLPPTTQISDCRHLLQPGIADFWAQMLGHSLIQEYLLNNIQRNTS